MLSISFDVEEGGNKTNSFIDSLELQLNNPTVPLIPLQKLYQMVEKDIFYHYMGSLTTPPCTEEVSWWVLPKPLHISQEQMDVINAQWKNNNTFAGGKGNNRAVQPLNGRTIYYREAEAIDVLHHSSHSFSSSLKSMLALLSALVAISYF